MNTRVGKQPKSRENWARIWFFKLAKFHSISTPLRWDFTCEDVIQFLKSKGTYPNSVRMYTCEFHVTNSRRQAHAARQADIWKLAKIPLESRS